MLERIEGFVGVADKWQAHFSSLFIRNITCLCPHGCTVVLLRNFVNWKVADVDVGGQLWLERRTDLAKLIPNDPAEERVPFDFICPIMCTAFFAKSVVGIAQESVLIFSNI